MSEFKTYRRITTGEMRPYVPGEVLRNVAVSKELEIAGHPTVGDMIARNPKDHRDQWLVAALYFVENFDTRPVGEDAAIELGARAFLR